VAKVRERIAPVDLALSLGAEVVELAQHERWSWQQRWRETYAQTVKIRTGKWVYSGYDWHAFSWKFTVARQGADAVALYLAERDRSLIVVPESIRLAAFRLERASPIDFTACMEDIEIFPPDLKWTVAFTHEQPDIGPFFCRAQWCHGHDGA
jgi:hypothetical protein